MGTDPHHRQAERASVGVGGQGVFAVQEQDAAELHQDGGAPGAASRSFIRIARASWRALR